MSLFSKALRVIDYKLIGLFERVRPSYVLIFVLLCLITSCATSFEDEPYEPVENLSYIGIDAQTCKTCFKPNHGGKIFKHENFGGNVYFGIKLNEYMFLEPGYQHLSCHKKAVLQAGDNIFGIPLPVMISPSVFKSKVTIRGPYINILVYPPILESSRFKPFFGFGISQTYAKFERSFIVAGGSNYDSDKKFESSHTLRRFIIGGNCYIRDDLSIKLSITHINTGRLKSIQTIGLRNKLISNMVIPKHSICYSIGLAHHF